VYGGESLAMVRLKNLTDFSNVSFQPIEIPVYMPKCGHSGCKGCVLSHILDAQEASQEVICSCSSFFTVY